MLSEGLGLRRVGRVREGGIEARSGRLQRRPAPACSLYGSAGQQASPLDHAILMANLNVLLVQLSVPYKQTPPE